MKSLLEKQLEQNINKLNDLQESINSDTVGHLAQFPLAAYVLFDELDHCKDLVQSITQQLAKEAN